MDRRRTLPFLLKADFRKPEGNVLKKGPIIYSNLCLSEHIQSQEVSQGSAKLLHDLGDEVLALGPSEGLLCCWTFEGDAISQYLLGPKEAEQHKDGLIEDMS